jgi:hypothetical protein
MSNSVTAGQIPPAVRDAIAHTEVLMSLDTASWNTTGPMRNATTPHAGTRPARTPGTDTSTRTSSGSASG